MTYFSEPLFDKENLDRKAIGERLKEIRKSRKIKQKDFAIACQYTPSYYNTIERGAAELKYPKYVELANRINVNPSYLIFGESVGPDDDEFYNPTEVEFHSGSSDYVASGVTTVDSTRLLSEIIMYLPRLAPIDLKILSLKIDSLLASPTTKEQVKEEPAATRRERLDADFQELLDEHNDQVGG